VNRAIEAIAVAVSISATLRQTPPSVKDAEKPWGDTHRGETGDLVAKALGGDDGDILGDALVGVEVERQARVVLLDDDAGRLKIAEGGDATSEGDCGIDARVLQEAPCCSVPGAGKPTPGDGRKGHYGANGGTRTFLTVLVRTRPMLATVSTRLCKRERGSSVLAF
jgi:hypothetical protein|tara:strand:- start:123 stop:620 length:498 start_codon:yes stop_codon:yes gene_type:complete